MRPEKTLHQKMDKQPKDSDQIPEASFNNDEQIITDPLDITLPNDVMQDSDRPHRVPALPSARDIDNYFNDTVRSIFNDSRTEKTQEERLCGEILRSFGDQQYCRACGQLLKQLGDDFNENVLQFHACAELARRRQLELEEELETIENTSMTFNR